MFAQFWASILQGEPVALLGACMAVLCVAAAAVGFSSLGEDSDPVLHRLRGSLSTTAVAVRNLKNKAKKPTSNTITKGSEQAVTATPLGKQLVHAGFRERRAERRFWTYKAALAAVPPVLLYVSNYQLGLTFQHIVPLALACSVLGYFAPNLWLRGRVKERQTSITQALPDAMDLLVTCVEAGLGIDAALARVADELNIAAPILAEEWKTTFWEIGAGMARPEAFHRLAERTGVEDLKSLAATLAQTEAFGTSISVALRIRADTMRVRRMQHAEERAAIVSVKMTVPLVFCILPSLVAIIMGPAVVRIVNNMLPNMGG